MNGLEVVVSSRVLHAALRRWFTDHFLPYLSAARPKVIAPTDRSMRTKVIPHVIWAFVLPNCSARSPTTNETVKKSKASHLSTCQ